MQTNNDFLQNGGEAGELVKAFDWASTPLGKAEDWPASLKASVGMVLHSTFPMIILWGEDMTCIYNDPMNRSMADKHPAIGKKAEEIWPEAWEFTGPLLKGVMETGTPVWFENQLIPLNRNWRTPTGPSAMALHMATMGR